MPARFIVTAAPGLASAALQELTQADPRVTQVCDFTPGVFLIETAVCRAVFTLAMLQADPIFVKHIMPVQAEVALTGQRAIDLPALLDGIVSMSPLESGEPFCVQCRRVGVGYDYSAKDVEVSVGSRFESAGAVPVFSDSAVTAHPTQKVISLYLCCDQGYIGCSTMRENLNEHADEYRVRSRQRKVINRAELKLLEALRKFGLSVRSGRALDLGAAPGGWTRVLADRGMAVVAVDPADLDERATKLPNVTHIKARAEDCGDPGMFDLIVNDMNIEPEESAAIMVRLAPHLKPGSSAIMTVKLVTRRPERLLAQVRAVLKSAYDVVRIKSLFHNRRELTVLLRSKQESSVGMAWTG